MAESYSSLDDFSSFSGGSLAFLEYFCYHKNVFFCFLSQLVGGH